jgi:hypothetical protein
MKNLPLILEAERRGVIRPDDQVFLAEGRRRNLPEFGSIVADKPDNSIAEWEEANSPQGRKGYSLAGYGAGLPVGYMETPPKTGEADVSQSITESIYNKIEESAKGTPAEGVTYAIGLADMGLEMGTSFLVGAPFGAVAGVVNVHQQEGGLFKWKNWEEYAPMFHHISEKLTATTTTKEGKKASEGLAAWIVENVDRKLVDKWIVEPNMKEGQENPLAALLGKTSAELLKLVLPLKLFKVPGELRAWKAKKAFEKKMDKQFPNEPSPMEERVAEYLDNQAKRIESTPEEFLEPVEPAESRSPMEQKFVEQVEGTRTDPQGPVAPEQGPIDPRQGIPEGYEVRNKMIRKAEPPPEEMAPEQRPVEPEVAPINQEAPVPQESPSPYADEVLFKWDVPNQKHSTALSYARKWETAEKLQKETKETILSELAMAGVKIKDATATESVLARSLFDHIEATRKKAQSIANRKPSVEKFDPEILNEQESLGYLTAQYGGMDATQFRKFGGTRGEDGFVHGKVETYDVNAKRTTRRTKQKDDYSRKRKTPGTSEWVEPLKEEGGLGIDQIHKSMIEDGHIPPDMDMSQFYELLREDLDGSSTRHYSTKATERVQTRAETDFDSMYKEPVPEKLGPSESLQEILDKPAPQEGVPNIRPDRGMRTDASQLWKKNNPGPTLSAFPDFNKFGSLTKSLENAYQRLKRSLFEPLDKRIVTTPSGKTTTTVKGIGLNSIRGIMSPSRVASIYKTFEPYFDIAKKAESTQHKISQIVHKRIESIVNDIGDNPQHKTDYNSTLLLGDFMSKEFTGAELTEMGVSPNVQRGYFKTRSYFNHMYTMMNKHLIDMGREPITRETGYVPHFFHDWFIKVDGEMLPTAKTWSEAVSRTNRIQKENPNAKIRIYPKQGTPFEKMDMSGKEGYKTTLADMDYLVTQDNMIGKFEMDPLQASEVMDGLFDMPARKRFLGNLLDRRGVKGWEKDVGFMVQHYGNITGRFIALDRFKRSMANRAGEENWRLDQPQEGIRKYIKDYHDDVNGNPISWDTALNNLGMFQETGLIGRHFKGDRAIQKMASGATSTMAITKLGLYNVSAAVVNSSQIMNTYAILGNKYTKIGLEKAHLFDKGKMSVRDKGIVKQLMIEEQLGLEHDSMLGGNIHDLGYIFNKTTRLFQGVEQFNRRTVGLGAYYKFIAENPKDTFGLLETGPKNRNVLQHKAAIEYASKQIDRTQFDYGRYDSPDFIRRTGSLGSVLFQFKKFPIKQAEFMIGLGLKGAEAKRFWASYGIAIGLVGLPGANFIVDMIKENFGYDPILEANEFLAEWSESAGSEWLKKARASAGEMLMYGLPSQFGVNISGRIGISDMIPQDLSDLSGPMLNTIGRVFKLARMEEQDGRWAKILKAIATAPGSFVEGLQGATFGKRGRKITDLKGMDRVDKMFGFRTMTETREVNKQNVIRYNEKKYRELRAKYVDRAINAIKDNDLPSLKEIVSDYAGDQLGTGKSFKRAIKREMQQKKLTASQRQFFNQSKTGKYRNLDTFNAGR